MAKLSLRFETPDGLNPIKHGVLPVTIPQLLQLIRSLATGRPGGHTVLRTEHAATYATAGVVFGTATTGTVGATICAQAITVSASGGVANTAALFAAAVNANTHADIKGIFSASGAGFTSGEVLDGDGTGLAYASAAPVACVALGYDAQSANFAVAEIVTGGTSGAVGTVLAQTDAGATGTLFLGSVTGTFQNNETLTGSVAGAATADGAPATAAQLTYSRQTGNFADAEVVTGGTSLAVGTVLKDVDAGTTGTLYLGSLTATATVTCLLPGINGMPIAASGTGITISGSVTRFAGATKTYSTFTT